MANLTLALSGVGATGQSGYVIAPVVALSLPTPTLSISGFGAVPSVRGTLPAPVLAVTGTAGAVGAVTLSLPVPTLLVGVGTALALPTPKLAIIASVGAVGAVALTLPTPTLAVNGPNAATLRLPAPTLAASGTVGAAATAALSLPVPALTIAGQVPATAQLAAALPVPRISISGATGTVGRAANVLRSLALAAQGVTGAVGQATLTLPLVKLTASGYENVVGNVRLVLPHLQLVATGSDSAAAPAPTASNTIVMHTEQMGVTTYSNFPFNSFAQFGGVYLAASSAGIFTLGGNTDNGALIQAAARVGITDFSTSYLKRVDRVYVGYRTDGNLVLRVFTDEVTQRDYLLTATGKSGLHGNHVRLGKGLVARYWQFEVRNQNGADFELNAIELKPTQLRRRVGGGDA
ncbi:hypothetical protein [Burkholderia cenocepacia]|uniref:hypothetical protein n=1 Tax=Burkholderia cenocepacia TaxID=95486 RepID=UPI002ABD5A4B|nr:hypothetical protein [Burkholderia cenocepacia]